MWLSFVTYPSLYLLGGRIIINFEFWNLWRRRHVKTVRQCIVQFRLVALRQRQVIVQGQGSIADGFAWMSLMAWSGICWISYEWGGS